MKMNMYPSKSERKSDFYEVEPGLWFPRVTSILEAVPKPLLLRWAVNKEREMVMETAAELHQSMKMGLSIPSYLAILGNMLGKTRAHQKLSQKAKDLGKEIHQLIEWKTREMLGQNPGPAIPNPSPNATLGYHAWLAWAEKVNFKPLLIEQRVTSMAEGYSGTMDVYGEVDGVLTVIDYKSSKAIYQEALLQNAAYQKALIEMEHGKPEQGLVIRLPKTEDDPGLDPKTFAKSCVVLVDDVDYLYQVFLAVKLVWHWLHPEAPGQHVPLLVAEDAFAQAFTDGSAKAAKS
jgi:hypothetical protein